MIEFLKNLLFIIKYKKSIIDLSVEKILKLDLILYFFE